jgi:hypothetical protein
MAASILSPKPAFVSQREKFGSHRFPIRSRQHRRGGFRTRREKGDLAGFGLVQYDGRGRSPHGEDSDALCCGSP